MKALFEMEKVTKNTVRFAEVLEDELAVAKIGSIYVPKGTLKEIGWTEGKKLVLEVGVDEE